MNENDLQQTIDFWDSWLNKNHSANIGEFMMYGGRSLDACKELKALRAQLEPDGWISVEDRLPKKRHFVLVYAPMYRNVFECYLDGEGRWIFVNADRECTQLITHWRYLPRKPREG